LQNVATPTLDHFIASLRLEARSQTGKLQPGAVPETRGRSCSNPTMTKRIDGLCDPRPEGPPRMIAEVG
jgi:hypothetical protein